MDHKIKLGEHEYNVRMKLGVLDHIKELTGKDGLEFVQASSQNISEGFYYMLLAGMLCYQDKYGGQPVDKEALRKSVKADADVKDFKEMITLYGEFLKTGEAPAQETENPSPGPNVKNSPTDPSA